MKPLRVEKINRIVEIYNLSQSDIVKRDMLYIYNTVFGLNESEHIEITLHGLLDRQLFQKTLNHEAQRILHDEPSDIFSKSLQELESGIVSRRFFTDILMSRLSIYTGGDISPDSQYASHSIYRVLILGGVYIPPNFLNDTANLIFGTSSSTQYDRNMASVGVGHTPLTDSELKLYFKNIIEQMPLRDLAETLQVQYSELFDEKLMHEFDILKRSK